MLSSMTIGAVGDLEILFGLFGAMAGSTWSTQEYYMHDMESLMGRTAIKIGQNRVAATLIAIDAVCWGALLFFGIHYFTC